MPYKQDELKDLLAETRKLLKKSDMSMREISRTNGVKVSMRWLYNLKHRTTKDVGVMQLNKLRNLLVREANERALKESKG